MCQVVGDQVSKTYLKLMVQHFFRATWGQVTNVGMYTMQYTRVAIIFWGLVPLNPIKWYYKNVIILNPININY